MLKDLERSGLNKLDAKKMHLQALTEVEASAVLNSEYVTHGYVIPYHDVANKVTDYMRVKFLGELLNKKKKQIKYSQIKGSPTHLYFPPNITRWKQILKSTTTITFTEGEKKAYAACKHNITTIGLGGIWAFQKDKHLIGDFSLINFKDRKVILCFDNDSHTNPDVMKAINRFAQLLTDLGANVFIKSLPFDPYKKIGLDDYLLTNSKKDYDSIEEVPTNSLASLDEINQRIAYIQTTGKVYVIEHDLFVGAKQLCDTVLANNTVMDDKGNTVSIATQWLSWKKRREHKRLIYSPGEAPVTTANEFNLWPGWGCVPTEGSIKPFVDVVKRVFDNQSTYIDWFLDWVAYPIQHPGAKMYSAVMMHSTEHGTGKSSIGLAVGSMYGDNFKEVESDHLTDKYNEWAINRQFVLGDEILGADKREASDRIKNLITRSSITINKKYSPTYSLVDCINYFLTSNHVDMVLIESDDRRSFVWKIPHGSGITLRQGIALEKFRMGRGKQHLLNYFAYEHQITKGFDHRARPPMTTAKQELIDNSLTDIERFLTNVKTNPSEALSIDGVDIGCDLFTSSQVANLYRRHNPKVNVTSTAIGKAMGKVFSEVDSRMIRTSGGVQRIRALRNFNKWNGADNEQMREHYDKSKIALFDVKKKAKKHA